MNRLIVITTATLFIAACSTASSVQRADQSKSGFEGAVYDGEESVLRDDIPDSDAYRIFHQGATGFVSVQSVRNSAESRAITFCGNKGLRYELLRERVSVGAHIAGNFPRAELVFACISEKDSANLSGSGTHSRSRYEELRELKSLLDEGVITPDEYEQEKREILAE